MIEDLYDQLCQAWERYAALKRKADTTLLLTDGLAARQAWINFQNVGKPEEERARRLSGPNIEIFPVHKTRTPGPRA
jgi:hypothetical protein